MTYAEIARFINTAHGWLNAHPADRKFAYALRKMMKQAERLWTQYQEGAEDLDIEFCAEKDGVIQRDERGQFAFSKDGIRKRNAARKKLFESEVHIEPFIAKDVPPDLTDAERDAFTGFVLPMPDEDAPDLHEVRRA